MGNHERATSFGLYFPEADPEEERLNPIIFQERMIEVLEAVDGILSVIAYDGKSEDPEFITGSQQMIREEYGKLIDFLREHCNGCGLVTWNWGCLPIAVVDACNGLQSLSVDDSPSTIQEDAEGDLQEYIIPFWDPSGQLEF